MTESKEELNKAGIEGVESGDVVRQMYEEMVAINNMQQEAIEAEPPDVRMMIGECLAELQALFSKYPDRVASLALGAIGTQRTVDSLARQIELLEQFKGVSDQLGDLNQGLDDKDENLEPVLRTGGFSEA